MVCKLTNHHCFAFTIRHLLLDRIDSNEQEVIS